MKQYAGAIYSGTCGRPYCGITENTLGTDGVANEQIAEPAGDV